VDCEAVEVPEEAMAVEVSIVSVSCASLRKTCQVSENFDDLR
jgi:hypothetical protein